MLLWREIKAANLHYLEEHVNDNTVQDQLKKYARLKPTSAEVKEMGDPVYWVVQLMQSAVQMKTQEMEDQRRRMVAKEEKLRSQREAMYGQKGDMQRTGPGITVDNRASQTEINQSGVDTESQTHPDISYGYKQPNFGDVVMGLGGQSEVGKDALHQLRGESANIVKTNTGKYLSFYKHSSIEVQDKRNAVQKQVAQELLLKKQMGKEIDRAMNKNKNIEYNASILRNEYSSENPHQEDEETRINSEDFKEGELLYMAEGLPTFSQTEVIALKPNLHRRVQVYSFIEDSDLEVREDYTGSSAFSRY